jgi:hypothetical protein
MCRPLTENVIITSVAIAFNGVGWVLRQIAEIIKEDEQND